ncbi:MAG: arabinosyltransferase [Mycobacteriaceae bacterium]|nr:arabinosyltransferase [Mycobacteriaceae bacterium]
MGARAAIGGRGGTLASAVVLPRTTSQRSPGRLLGSTATARLIATVTGLIGFLFALAVPFLPVRQDVASINWPQSGRTSVSAPLVSYAPLTFSASIPCEAARGLPAKGGVLLSTIAPESADVARKGLQVKVTDGALSVVLRDIPLLAAPASELARCRSITVDSTAARTTAALVGGNAEGTVDQDVRPQLVGIFTELPADRLSGLNAHAKLDSRFTSTPTAIKVVAMLIAGLATMLSLVALHRLDMADGRGARRFLPAHWLRVTGADVVVLGVLLLWHFIGANTSDDGYILNMARVSGHAGYMANYYRWFGVPEAPFGWSYDVLALLTEVSTASVWVRLMALVPAVLCWLVISREVLPRLGVAVRNNRIALWTAGLVFLAFWLPYNNGLRPEPLIALGALLTWCSMERAIATGRLLPAAIAVLIAAFSLAAGPTGLICVAALIAGSRPVLQSIVARGKRLGGWRGVVALLAPGLAAGTVVLVAVFANQTLASVLESTRVRTAVGPDVKWFDERVRWDALLTMSPDGSIARRFGVFAMVLCLAVCTMLVLRKGGRIPGAAKGPANRILGIVFASMLLMMFTPTKWTHHFGVYAGLAGSLAALAAVAVGADGIRSLRNRALFAASVLFLLAMAFTSTNGWWYVSSYGIPWWDKPPSIHGKGIATGFLGLTVLALLLAAWFHYREPFMDRRARIAAEHSTRWAVTPRGDRSAGGRSWAGFASAPLTLAAAFVVLFELASLVKGAYTVRHSYSIAVQNMRSVAGHPCGLADKVLVETDPNAAMLKPVTPGAAFTAKTTGFTPDGVAGDLTADQEDQTVGGANSIEDKATKGKTTATTGAGTGSGTVLPFGLAARTPVMGSYTDGDKKAATFTSAWYRLDRSGPLLVITAAGRIKHVDLDGLEKYGQDVLVEYGRTAANGAVAEQGSVRPLDIGPGPTWRNLRVPLAQLPADADAVRIVAAAPDLTSRQWVAVTPPRVPALKTLQDVVGSTRPVLLDWHVGLAFPCQRPFNHRDGVAEIPDFRILADRGGADVANKWQDDIGGGPLGWTGLLLKSQTIPAYLDSDWGRDWGSLEKFSPLDPAAAPATVDVTVETRSGTAKEPPMLAKP